MATRKITCFWQKHGCMQCVLERAGGERGGRVAVREREHRARQRLLLLAEAVPAALRDRHCAARRKHITLLLQCSITRTFRVCCAFDNFSVHHRGKNFPCSRVRQMDFCFVAHNEDNGLLIQTSINYCFSNEIR